MVKKRRGLSQPVRQAAKSERITTVKMTLAKAKTRLLKQRTSAAQPNDSELDFLDIPELSDEQLHKMKRVGPGRPLLGSAPRKMISIKLDPGLLEDLKREARKSGKPYQSLIHEILEEHLKKFAA
jgi:uncharacterized protein (DUF4415 family)